MTSHVIGTPTGYVAGAETDRPVGLWARFRAWRAQRRRRAQIARELLSYTDRELFDLGISRADIPAIIDGTYRR